MSNCACLVELPESVRLKLAARKQPDVDLENRSSSRISACCQGILHLTSTPRALRQQKFLEGGGAVIKDISRTGICVYYHEQLFPQQTFDVEFQGRRISAIVVRCRYIQSRCFEIGAVIECVQPYHEKC